MTTTDELHAQVAALTAELDALKALLASPAAVRVNLLRGTIARPSDLHFEHDEHGMIATLLKKHRSVCRACAMLDQNPNATLNDFLAKMKTNKPNET